MCRSGMILVRPIMSSTVTAFLLSVMITGSAPFELAQRSRRSELLQAFLHVVEKRKIEG
jgi:hypothetical protein